MHDADDQALMAALRAADPVDPPAFSASARRRLEADWQAARAATDATSGTPGPAPSMVHPRLSWLVAAAIVAIIVFGAGAIIASVLVRPRAAIDRPEPPPADASSVDDASGPGDGVGNDIDAAMLLSAPAEAGAVVGSYRVLIGWGDGRDVVDVAGDTVRYRFGQASKFGPPPSWKGFAPTEPVYLIERITAGRQVFARMRVGTDGDASWYRWSDIAKAGLDRALAATPIPRLPADAAGFTPVDDAAAAASGQTRWAAPLSEAEIDFLGPFEPVDPAEQGEDVRVVLSTDRDRRVTSAHIAGDSYGVTLRFGMFDRLAPDTLPSADVATATTVDGMYADVCGSDTGAATMRADIRSVASRTPGVGGVAFVEPTFAEPAGEGPIGDPVYGVAIRFAGTAGASDTYDRLSRALDRLSLDEEVSICRTGTVNWFELDGPGS